MTATSAAGDSGPGGIGATRGQLRMTGAQRRQRLRGRFASALSIGGRPRELTGRY